MKLFKKFFEKDSDLMTIREVTDNVTEKAKAVYGKLMAKTMTPDALTYLDAGDIEVIKECSDLLDDSYELAGRYASAMDKVEGIDLKVREHEDSFMMFKSDVYDELKDIKCDLAEIKDMVERLCERDV